MDNIIIELFEIIKRYEESEEKFAELDIHQDIEKLIKKYKLPIPPMECLAEYWAFSFFDTRSENETSRGTHYGPMFEGINNAGNTVEFPNIKDITPEIIEYWTRRSSESQHAILNTRYAGLVWDFSKIVTGKRAHFTVAHTLIDKTIQMAKLNCYEPEVGIKDKLKYALQVAISINDNDRVLKLRDTIIEFEDLIAQDNKPGLWGFSYDILWDNDKLFLTENQKEKLIKDLEDRLLRVSLFESPNFDPWSAESAAIRLAKHYRKLEKREDVKRVLFIFKNCFEHISKNAAPLQASTWLQHVCSIYLEFNLNSEAQQIADELGKIGAKVNEGLQTISHEIKVSGEEMDQFTQSLIEGNLEEALLNVTGHFLPKRNVLEKQIKELSKDAPLSFMVTTKLQDSRGRIVATVGSIDDDLEGHIILQMSQNIRFSAMFLYATYQALFSKFDIDLQKLEDYIFKSPLFRDDKKEIIRLGLKAYFDKSYIIAIHLLIPQIEEAIRVLFEKNNLSIMKPSRDGGEFNLRLLDELLRDPLLINIFGENVVFYFRVLLTDKRGLNLRNEVCHGLVSSDAFHVDIANRILHIILCLALVREQVEEKEESNGENE